MKNLLESLSNDSSKQKSLPAPDVVKTGEAKCTDENGNIRNNSIFQVQINTEQETTKWQKLDDYNICKTIRSDDLQIKTIFNFKADKVTTLHSEIDPTSKEVIHRHPPIIEYFRQISNKSEIKEAQAKLQELGGKPIQLKSNNNKRKIKA